MRRLVIYLLLAAVACSPLEGVEVELVPPGRVTDKAALDIRTGILEEGTYDVDIFLLDGSGRRKLTHMSAEVLPGEPVLLRESLSTQGLSGSCQVLVKVRKGLRSKTISKPIDIIPSPTRSPRTIDGAWAGLYHWSEQEALHWNKDIRLLTAKDWRAVVRSMHEVGMDIIVIQELMRNEQYAGRHDMTVESYSGKAFYPSDIYSARMDIACPDPVEAIMAEADLLGMHVLPGIGMFAWFDFGEESLRWHMDVTREVLRRYGHHPSFYGFYVSEECFGSLVPEIAPFFEKYSAFCRKLAPAKPIMLATNCFGLRGKDAEYASLLRNLDILCPFGFSRMPDGDLSGDEAAALLQGWCEAAGAHLWMDLEAFEFNPDGSLRPRSFDSIRAELDSLSCFEQVLCYQYPGVFNNPSLHPQVGEAAGIALYRSYAAYRSAAQ